MTLSTFVKYLLSMLLASLASNPKEISVPKEDFVDKISVHCGGDMKIVRQPLILF